MITPDKIRLARPGLNRHNNAVAGDINPMTDFQLFQEREVLGTQRSTLNWSEIMKTKLSLILAIVLVIFLPGVRAENKIVVRFGHFPNITHAQGVIAHALTRQGKGWFEQRL